MSKRYERIKDHTQEGRDTYRVIVRALNEWFACLVVVSINLGRVI
jgi:hypothetical protein